MNEQDIHELIMKQVCREISMIAEQIQKTNTISEKDVERLDKLYHIKKDMLTTQAMMDAEGYSEGMSGMRGRSPMTGRYISRDGGSYENGYNSGYSQGYSQAMNQMSQNQGGGNSGHWPMQNPYYPDQRRW